jgi:phosphomannomutase
MNNTQSSKGLIAKAEIEKHLQRAIIKIKEYLESNKSIIRPEIYKSALHNVPQKLTAWLNNDHIDELSPNAKRGIIKAIKEEKWERLIDAFLDEIAFGTGGIRGIAAFATREDESELELLAKGIDTEILRGPNTINDLVLMLKSAGVAKYASDKKLQSIVIGYDSRIQGATFAELITRVFLKTGMKVYLFDEACPYPELTFAIPQLKADMGILISASHNDRRYNGYKLSAETGAQFEKSERDFIYYNYILNTGFEDIEIEKEIQFGNKDLIFLGGDKPLKERLQHKNDSGEIVNKYYGRENDIVNMHKMHMEHIQQFILDPSLVQEWAPKVYLGYSAYHGAGRKAVPALLDYFHFKNLQKISKLDELNGLFPCFALEQQPDPGDNIAAEVAVNEFRAEYGNEDFKKLDVLIGTDPDADRTGFIVKVPSEQIQCYKAINRKADHLVTALQDAIPNYKDRDDDSWHLLDADNAWTLLLWYRLKKEAELNGGTVPDFDKKFISLSHTTSDSMVKLVQKHRLGVIKTWVGFAYLANSVYMTWDGKKAGKILADWNDLKEVVGAGDPAKDAGKKIFKNQSHPVLFDVMDMDNFDRSFNYAALEQSNGYSILGPKPNEGKVWGKGGHVRDKDGTFAAILIAEVQAYAKSLGKTLIELLDENIYLDPDIGLFVNYYEPEPYWGQFEGPTGMSKKIDMLQKTESMVESFEQGKELSFAGQNVVAIKSYRTGKYDALHRWKRFDLPYYNGFPEEGIRFFFGEKNSDDHLTVRPSGTSQCLRFHVQLKAKDVNKQNLYSKKEEYYEVSRKIVADVRGRVGA